MSLIVDIEKKLDAFTLNVSFEADGGVMGVLGESGCGKSMTLKCIAGIEKPDRGRIVLNGVTLFDSERRVNLPPQKRGIGYLFQTYSLFPNMTLRQNILCGMRMQKDKAERERILGGLIALMRLEGLEGRRPGQLSGGERQRAALARILAGNPDILLLDEPFSSLDSHLKSRLRLRMQELLSSLGKNALLVTHSRDEAYQLCGKIAVMERGRLFSPRDTKELFQNPESRRAALLTGCKNVADAGKAGEYEVEVPFWGVRFSTALPVSDKLCAIAVRAHSFNPKTAVNRFPVNITGVMEEPFENAVQFRYANQKPESPDIWRVAPKADGGAPLGLGVAPEDILPLYE